MPNTYEKACKGKNVYFNQEDTAFGALKILQRAQEIVYPYQCPYCHFWHLGHPKKQEITASPGDWIGEKVKKLKTEIQITCKKRQAHKTLLSGIISTKAERLAQEAAWIDDGGMGGFTPYEMQILQIRLRAVVKQRKKKEFKRSVYEGLRNWENEGGFIPSEESSE